MSKELLGIEQVKKFGETEIEKATLNIPTIKKDECKNKVQTEEKLLEATKEIKRY